MELILLLLASACMLVGLLGCVVPVLPGPPLAYVALLLLQLSGMAEFTTTELLVWLCVVVVVQVLDYVVPMLGSKLTGGSRWGSWGCFLGTLVGLFFMPWGLLVGPFVGAFVGELIGGRMPGRALLSGFGSLVGFLMGTVLKCIVCGYFLFQAVRLF